MKTTTVKLDEGDVALIIKEDGKCVSILPKDKDKNEDVEIKENELLLLSLSMYLKDPNFINLIKGEFVKKANEKFGAPSIGGDL